MAREGRAGSDDSGGRARPFEAPFGTQGKRAGILIGTSRLSMNKHAREYHESILRANYFIVSIRMEREGVEKAGGCGSNVRRSRNGARAEKQKKLRKVGARRRRRKIQKPHTPNPRMGHPQRGEIQNGSVFCTLHRNAFVFNGGARATGRTGKACRPWQCQRIERFEGGLGVKRSAPSWRQQCRETDGQDGRLLWKSGHQDPDAQQPASAGKRAA